VRDCGCCVTLGGYHWCLYGSEDVKRQIGAVSWYWDRNKPLNPGPKPPTKYFSGFEYHI
jgi:hypothetical protein